MTLIKDITIVTMNPDREIITNGAIRIEGSKIVAIDKSENFPESPASINGAGMVALPGLIAVSYTHLTLPTKRIV